MTISSITLTNPGAEAGDISGWTVRAGSSPVSAAVDGNGLGGPHAGSKMFCLPFGTSTGTMDQEWTITAGYLVAVDAGNAAVRAKAWIQSPSGLDYAVLYVQALDTSHVQLASYDSGAVRTTSYSQVEVTHVLPANTRYIRIGVVFVKEAGNSCNATIDDFTLEASDDASTDFPVKVEQLGAVALVNFATTSLHASQLGGVALAAGEGSTGLWDIRTHQLGAVALVRGFPGRNDLRAWYFIQDDHPFYGIQLGRIGTLVFDKLSRQWVPWSSPDYVYWRANDVTDWQGRNLACDSESGKIWTIDPTGRLDYGTTPIRSVITGQATVRARITVPCFMAELSGSEGQPPTGIDASTVGITLRTSDDGNLSFLDHGTITGEALGEAITARWYGLGLMTKPGRTFEIIDTGYFRRIDGLDAEFGNG